MVYRFIFYIILICFTESRQGQIYPWKRNKFFEQRRKELGGVMTEHEPHAPVWFFL